MNTKLPLNASSHLVDLSRPIGRFLAKTKASARLWSAAALAIGAAISAPLSVSAATITWGPATTISGNSDVTNSGAALYADYYGSGSQTINGVTFTPNSTLTWSNVSFSSGFSAGYGGYSGAAAPFNTLSNAYQKVLSGGVYGGNGSAIVTMKDLTVGRDYSVQIWLNDSRAGIVGRSEAISGSAVSLIYNSTSALGGVGQYSVGVFASDNTNQSFTLSSSALQFNAISVRDLGSAIKTWVGTSGTSWGTATDWNPAATPTIPGDSVLFNAASTLNLATVLDTSYAVSTLTLSNAPAPVSVGPDGFTLTLNTGINLSGASQNLTISDALTLGSSQTWNVANGDVLAINGAISYNPSALTVAGGGTVLLGGGALYTGNTTVSSGTLNVTNGGYISSSNILVAAGATLAFSGNGIINYYGPVITLAGGATLDVSAYASAFSLGAATVEIPSAGVVINGTNDFSTATLALEYDGVNPPLIQTNGTMTLSPSTVIMVNNPGGVLLAGNYTLIAAATAGNLGQVLAPSGLPAVVVTGNGTVGAASLALNATGGLDLVVSSPDAWTGATDNFWTTAGNWNPSGGPSVNAGAPVLFNSSSVANLATVLNANISVQGVSVLNPTGPVTIGGANTLTLYAGALNLSGASQNLTITAPLIFNASQSWIVTNSRTLTISGAVTSGSGGNVAITGGGTVQMGAADVLDGLTNNTGTCDFTLDSTLDLNGHSQVLNALNGGTDGIVDNTGAGAVTLTLGGNGDSGSFGGIIQNSGGPLALVEAAGQESLLATNTYASGTTINGTLIPGNPSSFGPGPISVNPGATLYAVNGGSYSAKFMTNPIALNGGTLRVGGGSARQWGYTGPITVAGNSSVFCDGGTGYNGFPYNYAAAQFINGPVNLGNGNTLTNFGSSGGISIGGNISGANDTIIDINGYLWLAGSNSFTGTIQAAAGTVIIATQYAAQNATLDLSNATDTGAYYFYAGNSVIGGITGSNNLNLQNTVQFGNNNLNTTYFGAMTNSGSLVKIGTGTLTLAGTNTYTGSTTVSNGTLALVGGSVASANLTVAGGATLDVSGANPAVALISSSTLANSAVGAVLNGAVNASAGTLSLVYDGVTPAFIKTNGSLTISAATVIKVNNVGLPLASGTHTLIAAATAGNLGPVTGALPAVTVIGNGAVGAPTLQIDGSGNLNLVVATGQAWTGASGASWNTGGNWLTGVIPPAGGTALFNSSSTNNLATVLNANFNLSTLTEINPPAPVSIGGVNTLTISNGISMSFASQPMTITAPVVLGASQTWTVSTNAASVLNVSGNVSGTAALTVAGGGIVNLGGANTYTGTTTVSAGTLVVSGPYTGAATGSTFVANGGSLIFNLAAGTANFFGDGYGNSPQIGENSVGSVILQSGTLNVNTISGSAAPYGSLRLGDAAAGNGTIIVTNGTLNVPGRILIAANGGTTAKGTITISGGTINLGTVGAGSIAGNGQGVIWFGGGNSTVNLYGGTLALYSLYDPTAGSLVTVNLSGGTLKAENNNATFTDVTAGSLTLKVSTNGVTINPAGYAITIPTALTHDGSLSGADGGLVVNDSVGGGTLTLSGANTYSGNTTISNGTLLVNSSSGTGAVIINGGTLGGTGAISGPVTNNANGTLSPGVSGSGKLTLNGNVTLLAGSTNTFAVNGTTATNNSVLVGAAVTYGGVLNIVTNGTFTLGEQFTLYKGAGATNASSFASIAGSPSAGLAFSFANGVLSVITAPTGPTLTSVSPNPVSGSSYPVTLGLTGTGFTGASAVLLTNLSTLTGSSYPPVVNSSTSISVSFVPGTSASTWNATVVNGTPSGQVPFTVTAPTVARIDLGNVKSAGPGNVVLSGTGGVPGNSYAVESATNVPQAVWIPLVTNVFDGSGNFSYTNSVVPGTAKLFLRIQQ